MSKKSTIKCPHCGREYLAAEIYYPKSFFGNPSNIIKDETGTILGYNGSDLDTYETFQCDQCNKLFSVDAVVTFKTAPVVDLFDSDLEDFKESEK